MVRRQKYSSTLSLCLLPILSPYNSVPFHCVPFRFSIKKYFPTLSLCLPPFLTIPFRSAPSDNDWYSPCPVPTERSGTVMTTMGTPLEQCNFFPSYLFFLSSPLRSVGTGQGLYQSLSLGAEQNGERRKTTTMGTPLEQCNFFHRYLFFLRSSFRSAPWERGKGCTNHCGSERSGMGNGERIDSQGRNCMTVPLRSVRTRKEQMFKCCTNHCGSERSGTGNGERRQRWVHYLNNAIYSLSIPRSAPLPLQLSASLPFYLLTIPFRSVPFFFKKEQMFKCCTNHCGSERSGTGNGERRQRWVHHLNNAIYSLSIPRSALLPLQLSASFPFYILTIPFRSVL